MVESSLDLGKPTKPAATADTTPNALDDLVLTPPTAVPAVPAERASAMMPLDQEEATELTRKAHTFVEGLAALDPHSPEFSDKIRDVNTMGDADIRAAAQVANRMLERPQRALQATRGTGAAGSAVMVVSDGLVELRRTVEDLDPSQIDKTSVGKLLSKLPFGDKVRDYFAKYSSSQENLNRIIRALQNGQEELRKDNAAIDGEKVNLWNTMQRLQEYATLAGALDSAVEAHIATVHDPKEADTLRSDILFAIRQKHQDLLTQLAVAAQGYLALDMVRRNNIELDRGVKRATETTVFALRTAVIVAQALANQKLVLDQVTAVNETTNNLIVSTSRMLKDQSATINEQAASTTVSVESLKEAFNNIYDTMDTIDTFKAQAVDNMAQTVDALQTELTKASDYLERSRKNEGYSA